MASIHDLLKSSTLDQNTAAAHVMVASNLKKDSRLGERVTKYCMHEFAVEFCMTSPLLILATSTYKIAVHPIL